MGSDDKGLLGSNHSEGKSKCSVDDDSTQIAATVMSADNDKTVIIGANAVTALAPGSDETVIVSDGAHSGEGPTLTLGNTSVINNRFELLEILGSGGMGVVFKAKDRRKVEAQDRDPYVAIKLLNDDFKAHPHSIISLQREARRSQKLAHPNIVNVHDFDRDQDQVYMTMECLEGKPLDELLADNKGKLLDPSAAHVIMRDLCAAMSHAHKNNIAHSDFKPGNIFVIENGHAKVLDFGIARAVTNVDTTNSTGNTLFDAGSLGALTPAYASLEMLTGELPEVSDDVYALGCVAYELFAGRHPFDKKNAVDAKKAGLKPARIKSLSSKQWRALRKALAYKRVDRFANAQEFWLAFDDSTKPVMIAAGLLLAIIVGVAGWSYQQQQLAEFDKVAAEKTIKAKLELKFAKGELSAVLARSGVSARWNTDLNQAVDRYAALVSADDVFLRQTRQQAAQRYLDQAGVLRTQKKFDEAKKALQLAELWGTKVDVVTEMQTDINQAISERDAQLAAELQEQKSLQEEARRQAALQRQQERERLEQERKLLNAERAQQHYSQTLAAVESSLLCTSNFSFDVLRQQLNKLKALDANRYSQLYPGFSDKMAACVRRAAAKNPVSAEELKTAALAVFEGSPKIQAVKIDYCLRLAPGSGRRSSNSCNDRLADGGRGPKLVVVPGLDGTAWAIGKYEVSSKELGRFCKATNSCGEIEDQSSNLPARHVSFETARAYADWLGAQTGFDYRLPTYEQWLFAAKAKGGSADPNRNCTVNAMGVRKGEKVVSVTTGRTNGWGLVNTVGNVQEFTVSGSDVIAAGGRHTDRLDNCLLTTRRVHDGSADNTTGFRLVRALSH